MKIMYLISVFGNGIGGHYYSLKSTVEAISENAQCVVVSIGPIESPVINTINSKVYNIIYSHQTPIVTILKLINIIKSEQPDVFHAFDTDAIFYANIISHYYKKAYITTLCGGPNPTFFPKVKNLILFSNENKKFFEENPNYKRSNIYLIPNRIWRPLQDYNLINEIQRKLNPKAHIFLRIARISSFHKESILQSIALVEALNRENVRSQLVVVGDVQERDVYDEIVKKLGEYTILLTDDRYIVDASKIIDVSEVVIGTGRGFMEGASMKKVLLCPSSHSKYPILATRNNMFDLFDNNFSLRSINTSSGSSNLSMIMQVLQDDEMRSNLAGYMQRISQEYFQIESVTGKYMGIYQELEYDPKIDILGIIFHFGKITHYNSSLLRMVRSYIRR